MSEIYKTHPCPECGHENAAIEVNCGGCGEKIDYEGINIRDAPLSFREHLRRLAEERQRAIAETEAATLARDADRSVERFRRIFPEDFEFSQLNGEYVTIDGIRLKFPSYSGPRENYAIFSCADCGEDFTREWSSPDYLAQLVDEHEAGTLEHWGCPVKKTLPEQSDLLTRLRDVLQEVLNATT